MEFSAAIEREPAVLSVIVSVRDDEGRLISEVDVYFEPETLRVVAVSAEDPLAAASKDRAVVGKLTDLPEFEQIDADDDGQVEYWTQAFVLERWRELKPVTRA